MQAEPIRVSYFSDILCIWAYVAERRLSELHDCFGDKVAIESHYISVFGDTRTKFTEDWKSRGGWQGYANHVAETAARFDHIKLGSKAWNETRPASSLSPHLTLKAVQVIHPEAPEHSARCALAMREAFFCDGQDIGDFEVQLEILKAHNISIDPVQRAIRDGRAFAALAHDMELQKKWGIEGSPTFVLNDGRQKLYGNVGFKIIEANILELLRKPAADQASWC